MTEQAEQAQRAQQTRQAGRAETPGIFDTHAHYDDEAFDRDREELLGQMEAAGIKRIVNASSSLATIRSTAALAARYPFLYGTAGIHPDEVGELDEESFAWLKEAAQGEKIVAIGEIGLDYHWNVEEKEVQKKWFVRQLELARELGLPAVIHSREAAQDTLEIIKEEAGGVVCDLHCFSYGVELAREYLNRGHYLGIGGVLTFKNAKKLKEVASYAPLDLILLETDCPYLSPEPNRGKRNSSLNLPFVVRELARLKGVDEDRIIEATWENALRFYRMEA